MRLWELNKNQSIYQRCFTSTLITNLFIILNIRFYCTFIVVKGNQLLDAIVWYATTHAEGLYVIQLHNRNNVLWLLELPLKVSMKMHQKPVVIMKKSFIVAQNGELATQKGSRRFVSSYVFSIHFNWYHTTSCNFSNIIAC